MSMPYAGIGDLDRHLLAEGRHEQLWEVLGARVGARAGVDGVWFAVWAPHAREVRVAGDFNYWSGDEHIMALLPDVGVWQLFVPGLRAGTMYKFVVHGHDGSWTQRADPLARYAEVAPSFGSVVWDSAYTWGDGDWLAARPHHDPVTAPLSIYEVHLGSWRRDKSYRDLAEELVGHVTHLGFTHVELMPVMQHPYGGSWGYHVTGYYAPDSRLGTPDDFKYLVDRLHRAGIGVILDWVPGHFATDPWGLPAFDGTPLYEHTEHARAWHPEWGSWIFDLAKPQVRNFLVANAAYWLEEFHADGLRVDGVASMLYLDYARQPGEWVPNALGGNEDLDAVSFLQELNATVYKRVPGIMTLAEESTAWPGVTAPTDDPSGRALGFGFKWNMGWMHDTLAYLRTDPMWRGDHHHELTFALVYAWSEAFVLPLSHDEVVHGKGSLLRKIPGPRDQQLATLRAYFGFMWAHPGKQLLFMGSELGQEAEWAESRELDWWLLDLPEHLGLQDLVRGLNLTYRATPALWARDRDPGGFGWLVGDDTSGSVVAWARYGHGVPPLVSISNFSANAHHRYPLRFPGGGVWDEVLNTDAVEYGGTGLGNLGAVQVADDGSASVVVPALSTVWFRQRWQ